MTQVGFVGQAPTVLIKPIANPERRKYEQVWQRDEYRQVSPGEQWAQLFLQQARPAAHAEVIDFGCGTGRGALMLALFGRMRVTMLDFAANCLDPEVAEATRTQPERLKFVEHDLLQPAPVSAKYGYCCDVLEHIPTDRVDQVLVNMLASAQHLFLAISTVPDQLGALIGETLHLTVQPMAWWIERLQALGAVVHYAKAGDQACVVYCSAWKDAAEVVKLGKINVGEEVAAANVLANLRAGWPQITPHEVQDREIVLLAGGWSLDQNLHDIAALRAGGAALVTVNGSYGWALAHGLQPSLQVVLDARSFNARFTKPVTDTCRYLIASQCDPSTLEQLPRDRTWLWHCGVEGEGEALARELGGGHFFPVPGGSTVVLRVIPLLRMLGFKRVHIFGFDSCVRPDGAHHAYEQVENDHDPVIPVTCGDRTFQCAPWMVSQAQEFLGLVNFMGNEVELAVYGGGLIAHILKTGADLSTKD